MGKPPGPGKMYCTSCGELIDRESAYCAYCGAAVTQRKFPTERSGPATPADDRSIRAFRSGNRSETSEDDSTSWGEHTERGGSWGDHAERSRTDRGDDSWDQRRRDRQPREHHREYRPRESRRGTDRRDRDFASPRVGVEDVEEPRYDESPLRTVGVAAGIGVVGIVLLAIVSAIGGAILFGLDLSEIAVLGVATAIGQYVGFMGLGLWYLRYRGFDWGRVWAYLGLRMPTLRELGMVVLGWLVIFVLIIIVGIVAQIFLPEPAENQGAAALAEGADNLALYFGAVAFMFLVVGPCEELLYRGVVQNRLRERLPAVPSILIASAVFAAVHVVALAGDPLAMVTTVGILFVPALVLGALYEYTGNIVVVSLLHGLHNSIIITVLFFGPEMEEAAEFIAPVLMAMPL